MKKEKLKLLLFLIPAILVAAIVALSLPATIPQLKEIPEKLELILPVVAEADMPEEDSSYKTDTEKEREETEEESSSPEVNYGYTDGTFTGNASGYGGEVKVAVTVTGGLITDIQIVNAPGETEPYFTLAKTVIPQILTGQTWEVDAISGATYSSNGIIGAVRNAITGETVINEAPKEETRVIDSVAYDEPSAYKDGTYYGTAQGFGGPVSVEVVIEGGKIASIVVTDSEDETYDYFMQASMVIPRIISSGSPNVDTVSGATYSSTGIISAVKRALSQAAGDAEAQEEESTGADDEQSPVSYPAGSEDIQANALADGTFTGRANVDDGELFKYVICADVVIKDGAIESVTTQITDDESEDPEDNEAYIDYAVNGRTRRGVTTAGIPSQVVEKQGVSGVDTVSGATYSSKGIIEAVRDALTQAAANGPADDEKGTKTQDSEEETSSPADQNEEGGKEPEEHAEPETGDQQITSVYKDGIYTASSWCEDGDMFRYRVTVTVIITDGRIETMKYEVTDDGSLEGIDNEPYIRRALDEEQEGSISARIISKGSADNVDAVSGATYTSYAMITAAKLALAEALH